MYHLEEERVQPDQAHQGVWQDSLSREAHQVMIARLVCFVLLKHQPCSPCGSGSWAVQMRSVPVSVEEKVQAW